MTVSLILSWPPRALNPNWTGKLRDKMRAKKAYREECWACTLAAGIKISGGDGLIALRYTFRPPDRRSRDDDNCAAMMKSARDGIARALGIDDKHFRTMPVVFGDPDPAKRGFVEVQIYPCGAE